MTFKKHWITGKITSSDGYSVRIISRGALVYDDERNRIVIGIEILQGRAVDIFRDQVWTDQNSQHRLTDTPLKNEVLNRVTAALEFCGTKVEVID